jgi:hypothetical protein
MRKILIIIILAITSGCSITLFGQNADLTIGKDRLSSIRPDIDTLTGITDKLIRFRFDTLFFLNRIGVNDYVNTKKKNKVLIDLTKSLIDTMTNSLRGFQGDFNNLNQSIALNNSIIKKSLEDNNLRISEVDKRNTDLSKNNIQIQLDLKDAKNQIAAAKWKSLGTKMIFGTVGIGLGIGIGALLVK